MSVPDAAVSFLLENIAQSIGLGRNYGYDLNEKDLRDLKVIEKAFSKYNHGNQVLVDAVRKNIRSIALEAENATAALLIHNSMMKKSWHRVVPEFLRTFTGEGKLFRDLKNDISRIAKRVKDLQGNDVKDAIGILELEAIKILDRPAEEKAPKTIEEDEIIGFHGAAERVREILTKGAQEFEVVSITGMSGLGKTTVSKKVFNHPIVDYEFMIRAFVHISNKYDWKQVLLKILAYFTKVNSEIEQMPVAELENHLFRMLERSQYLIVLDDVWEPEDWDKFKHVFPQNNKRCRVLLTTCRDRVAKYASPHVDPYKLNVLPLKESKQILRRKIFDSDECPRHLQVYETKIAIKCEGLLFALVDVASIIVDDPYSIDLWRDVYENMHYYIAKHASQTNRIVESMYDRLPQHLRQCLLYLGVCGEDFEIPVWKLVRLWIAEGFVQPTEGSNMEDVAEEYLKELVDRNLIKVEGRKSNGKIKTCRTYGILREFFMKKAVEEIYVEEIKKENLIFFLSQDSQLKTCHRLCINNSDVFSSFVSSMEKSAPKHPYSFLTFIPAPEKSTKLEQKMVPIVVATFKLLKVLEIQSVTLSRFPSGYSGLYLLKYIAISLNSDRLPKSLSRLLNLQTLIVHTTSPTLDIKVDIWKLRHFRHLHTNVPTKLPSPSCDNEKIQTLCTISTDTCTREVFERSPRVRKLVIRGEMGMFLEKCHRFDVYSSLSRLEVADKLKIINDESDPRLPISDFRRIFPPRITELTLQRTFLDWEDMSILGELEFLEILKLRDEAFKGVRCVPKKGGFRRLKHLLIGHTDLEEWDASGDHFPQLRSLELIGLNKLLEFPLGLADIASLQSVILRDTNPIVVSAARNLQQDNKRGVTNNFKLSILPLDLC